jgi:hypothetical protein
MSTILKALRRLEQEKSAQEDRPLRDEVAALESEPSRRRGPWLLLLSAVAALGLGLGASLYFFWPREGAAPVVAAQAPPVRRAAPEAKALAPPPVVAAPAAPEVAAALPEAPVAAAPPAATPLPEPAVAVLERPEPPRAKEPAAVPGEGDSAQASAPLPGELPPFARKPEPAEEPEPAAVEPVLSKPAPAATLARSEPVVRKTPAAPKPAETKQAKPAPSVPNVLVSRTIWHPQRERRLAMVAFEGGAPRELHEGDAIGSLVVAKIEPSGVVFLHDGAELRRGVGAKN